MKISRCSLVLVLIVSHSILTAAEEVENESSFNYIKGSGKGPEDWGKKCNNGKMQSPIDFMKERVQEVGYLGRLKLSYRPSNSTLENKGHDIKLNWVDDAGSIEINGIEYELKQCHWHSPSEHTIDGRSFDLEVHMVHETKDKKKKAVVGIMYKLGRPDPFLKELMGLIKSIADTHKKEVAAGTIDPRHIKIGSRKYYRYLGSLTTPPCTEHVTWTVSQKVRTVSRKQVRLLRQAVDDKHKNNARPTQPLNKREVLLYNPSLDHCQKQIP